MRDLVMDWLDHALCRTLPATWWEMKVPNSSGHLGNNDLLPWAKQVCAECPVIAQCLEWALIEHPTDFDSVSRAGEGMFIANRTPKEIEAIRKERARGATPVG